VSLTAGPAAPTTILDSRHTLPHTEERRTQKVVKKLRVNLGLSPRARAPTKDEEHGGRTPVTNDSLSVAGRSGILLGCLFGSEDPINERARLSLANIFSALAFAAEKHRRQRRKDHEATPYINHIIAVTTALAVEGEVTDEATLLCGLLHDTVEDTATTFAELSEHFGPETAALVGEVTDDKSLEKSVRKQLQIEHAPTASERAMAHPPAHWPLQRRLEYFDWSEKVVAGCRGINPGLEQAFDEAVALARSTVGK
jgi:guanosine-3',5'-bis(diphosphate) 3'-pyrophosphohydrolase